MSTGGKKILIIEGDGFCRICTALLEHIGYGIETLSAAMIKTAELSSRFNRNDIGIVITSYAHTHSLLKEIKKRKIPSLILFDNIDGSLMNILDGLHNCYCMVKPIDYQKLRSTINMVMSGNLIAQEGFSIV